MLVRVRIMLLISMLLGWQVRLFGPEYPESVPIMFEGSFNKARPSEEGGIGVGTLYFSPDNPRKAKVVFRIEDWARQLANLRGPVENDEHRATAGVKAFLRARPGTDEYTVDFESDDIPVFRKLMQEKPKQLLAPWPFFEDTIKGAHKPFSPDYEKLSEHHHPLVLVLDFSDGKFRIALHGKEKEYRPMYHDPHQWPNYMGKAKLEKGHSFPEPYLEDTKPMWDLAPGARVSLAYSVDGEIKEEIAGVGGRAKRFAGQLPMVIKRVLKNGEVIVGPAFNTVYYPEFAGKEYRVHSDGLVRVTPDVQDQQLTALASMPGYTRSLIADHFRLLDPTIPKNGDGKAMHYSGYRCDQYSVILGTQVFVPSIQ